LLSRPHLSVWQVRWVLTGAVTTGPAPDRSRATSGATRTSPQEKARTRAERRMSESTSSGTAQEFSKGRVFLWALRSPATTEP
jgi:hypothetical protein